MTSKAADWRHDLEASRNLTEVEKQHFGFVLAWFESWRLKLDRIESGGSGAFLEGGGEIQGAEALAA